MNEQELKKYRNKLLVSDLILEVLLGKKPVSNALLEFPKDSEDLNIKCAFDALMYREADEDLRAKESDYAQVQDDFLMEIAMILKKNEDLPSNIISNYLNLNKESLISNDELTLKNILKKMKRMINL